MSPPLLQSSPPFLWFHVICVVCFCIRCGLSISYGLVSNHWRQFVSLDCQLSVCGTLLSHVKLPSTCTMILFGRAIKMRTSGSRVETWLSKNPSNYGILLFKQCLQAIKICRAVMWKNLVHRSRHIKTCYCYILSGGDGTSIAKYGKLMEMITKIQHTSN